MLAGSGIDQGSLSLNSQSVLRKSLKVARLNPVKGKEDWQTWLPQACAPLSDVTREAVKQAVIALNPPTYDGVQNMLGPNATEDETLAWYETYVTAYEEAQNEAYILVESYVDWSSSSIGKVMRRGSDARAKRSRPSCCPTYYPAPEAAPPTRGRAAPRRAYVYRADAPSPPSREARSGGGCYA